MIVHQPPGATRFGSARGSCSARATRVQVSSQRSSDSLAFTIVGLPADALVGLDVPNLPGIALLSGTEWSQPGHRRHRLGSNVANKQMRAERGSIPRHLDWDKAAATLQKLAAQQGL